MTTGLSAVAFQLFSALTPEKELKLAKHKIWLGLEVGLPAVVFLEVVPVCSAYFNAPKSLSSSCECLLGISG